MIRRSTYQPLRAARRMTIRDHAFAALGAASGMLALTIAVVGIVVTR